jgi:hypothetical protein
MISENPTLNGNSGIPGEALSTRSEETLAAGRSGMDKRGMCSEENCEAPEGDRMGIGGAGDNGRLCTTTSHTIDLSGSAGWASVGNVD